MHGSTSNSLLLRVLSLLPAPDAVVRVQSLEGAPEEVAAGVGDTKVPPKLREVLEADDEEAGGVLPDEGGLGRVWLGGSLVVEACKGVTGNWVSEA